MIWEDPQIQKTPPGRSLHTSNIYGTKMYVFGGWEPFPPGFKENHFNPNYPWHCSSAFHCLDLGFSFFFFFFSFLFFSFF